MRTIEITYYTFYFLWHILGIIGFAKIDLNPFYYYFQESAYFKEKRNLYRLKSFFISLLFVGFFACIGFIILLLLKLIDIFWIKMLIICIFLFISLSFNLLVFICSFYPIYDINQIKSMGVEEYVDYLQNDYYNYKTIDLNKEEDIKKREWVINDINKFLSKHENRKIHPLAKWFTELIDDLKKEKVSFFYFVLSVIISIVFYLLGRYFS